MSKPIRSMTWPSLWLAATLFAVPALGSAQVPVDANGDPIGDFEPAAGAETLGNEDIPLLPDSELQELVGPIALYPDDLLAIVLPASTFPLQVVQAARFLEDLEADPSLEPDEAWDDSVVALINYPEVVELLNEDLDWTWRLGDAVVAQQEDVVAAIETFRDRAYAAGNLKTDAHQTVARSDEGIIEIVPMEEDIIYVPYYEPEHVVVRQPRPVYYYYPRPYPVYYYPYPSSYYFDRGYFWGVTTAFSIGWYTDRLHVHHHSYRSHPYYGRYYYDRWWYRRPTINVYNTTYVNKHVYRNRDYDRYGDYWYSRQDRRLRYDDGRITRNRYYPGDIRRESRSVTQKVNNSTSKLRSPTRETRSKVDNRRSSDSRKDLRFRERTQKVADSSSRKSGNRNEIRFRERTQKVSDSNSRKSGNRNDIRFRERTQKATDSSSRKSGSRNEIRFRERAQKVADSSSRKSGNRNDIRFRERTQKVADSSSRKSGKRNEISFRERKKTAVDARPKQKAAPQQRTSRVDYDRRSKPRSNAEKFSRKSEGSRAVRREASNNVRTFAPTKSREVRQPSKRNDVSRSAQRPKREAVKSVRSSAKSGKREVKRDDRRAGKKSKRD